MRTALDAGHGFVHGRRPTGAQANGLVEDDLALDLVRRIGHHPRAAGHETIYTRPDETFIPLSERGPTARIGGCQLFLSIHCNAGPANARGAQAYVTEGDLRSREVARKLLHAIGACGMPLRGVKWDSQSARSRLRVLRDTYRHMPSVLLEIGFLTNATDARALSSRYWRDRLARLLSDAIAQKPAE